ncbi:MAG: PLP-dependent aminotransferase family protein [Pseudomonadota bacterium]
MSLWPPDLSQGRGPLYRRVAAAITDAIQAGILPPGSRLPSHRDMAYQLGVAVGSVAKAYGLLAEQGLVRARVGQGTVIEAKQGRWRERLTPVTEMVDLGVIILPPLNDPELLDASGRRTLTDIGAQWPLLGLTGYPTKTGIERQQKAVARWLRESDVPATPESVAITIGAQEALVSVLLTATRGGAALLCEDLNAVGTKNLFSALGLEPQGLAMDKEGVTPAVLEAAARSNPGAVLILRPSFQIPTAAAMSAERRQAIAALVRRYDLLLLECDTYGQFVPADGPPFAALLPEQCVYICSFASQTQTGLRAGLLHSPRHLEERIGFTRHALLLGTPPLIGEVMTAWIQSGLADRIIAAHRAELSKRHRVLHQELAGFPLQTQPCGPFAWLPLEGQDADRVAERAAEQGVYLLPSSRFVIGQRPPAPAVRLSLSSTSDRKTLRRGLALLRGLLPPPPSA